MSTKKNSILFSAELRKVSEAVEKIIATDDFPEGIRPVFLKEAVKDYPLRGGKRLRPALLMWSCGLLDGKPETAKFAAAAAEIYHNWTLVHDDIIDNDLMRRGKPSCHAALANFAEKKYRLNPAEAEVFGKNFAMLAGDLQQAWASNMLLKSEQAGISAELCVFLSRRLHELVNRELISGEALDVEFPLLEWEKLSGKKIEDMLCLKTGALLRFCAEAGALIALGSRKHAADRRVGKIGDFAAAAGVAFQLRDDWLGIFGSEELLGKPVGSDLSERKPTLLLYETWRRLDEKSRKPLFSLLGREKYSKPELDTVKKLIKSTGADELVLKRASELADSARKNLLALPDGKYRRLLLEWTFFLLGREK